MPNPVFSGRSTRFLSVCLQCQSRLQGGRGIRVNQSEQAWHQLRQHHSHLRAFGTNHATCAHKPLRGARPSYLPCASAALFSIIHPGQGRAFLRKSSTSAPQRQTDEDARARKSQSSETRSIGHDSHSRPRKSGFSGWISGFVKGLKEPSEPNPASTPSSNGKEQPKLTAQSTSSTPGKISEDVVLLVPRSIKTNKASTSHSQEVEKPTTPSTDAVNAKSEGQHEQENRPKAKKSSQAKLDSKKQKKAGRAEDTQMLAGTSGGEPSTEAHVKDLTEATPLPKKSDKNPQKVTAKDPSDKEKLSYIKRRKAVAAHNAEVRAKRKARKGEQNTTEGEQKPREHRKHKKAPDSTETQKTDEVPLETKATKKKKQVDKAVEPRGTTIAPKELPFEALPVEQPPVPRLAHNLDRVLFNRGVYNLRDKYSGVYNFDPYLENVMPATEFNFDAIAAYKTSSEDEFLVKTAADHGLRYVGSTSSMTSMLTHFHYLLSHWRELDLSMLSRGFSISETKNSRSFTEIYRAPQAIFLRYKDGAYAIDADKEYNSPNILMHLGQSLEKLLTLPADVFERFRKTDPRGVPEEEQDAPQSFHYSKHGKILMRSQLDAYDPRLPGSGVFDLKTRAVLPIRMSSRDYHDMVGYQILSDMGTYESYEREFYDMYRSTFLKYSLQVRMGRMEGIFIAYHNVEEIFGFQFMNLGEMDRVLHGQEDPSLGDQEFRASLNIVHDILDQATAEFPEKSIRLHFDTRAGVVPMMYIFAEPVEEEDIEKIQESGKEAMQAFEREIRGELEIEAPAVASPSPSSPEPTPPIDSLTAALVSNSSDPDPDPEAEPEPKPLLAWTLTTSSEVNGSRVARPENLSAADTWTVRYELRRIKDAAKAQSWYDMTKKRRRAALDFGDGDDGDGGDDAAAAEEVTLEEMMRGDKDVATAKGPKKKRALPSFYLDQLKGMARKGRAIREERVRGQIGSEKVVVGEGEKEVVVAGGEQGGVQGYMDWLYSERK